MSEVHPTAFVCNVERPSNDELAALMLRVTRREKGALARLHSLVTPLVCAFHEGHVQAGRASPEELGSMVTATLRRVYRDRLTYDRDYPFRAWLLQIARDTVRDQLGASDPGVSLETSWHRPNRAASDECPDAADAVHP